MMFDYRRIYASLGLNELTHSTRLEQNDLHFMNGVLFGIFDKDYRIWFECHLKWLLKVLLSSLVSIIISIKQAHNLIE